MMSKALPKTAFSCLLCIVHPNPMLHHCHHTMNWGHCESPLGSHCILYYVSSIPSLQHCQAYYPSTLLIGRGKWAVEMLMAWRSALPAAGFPQDPNTQLAGHPHYCLCPFRCQAWPLTSANHLWLFSRAGENVAAPLGAN